MSSVINTSGHSLDARRNLNKSQAARPTSLQRLSSDPCVDSAKNEAAGLTLLQRFTVPIDGADQAARNANDGISLAQTADGALAAATDHLQRIRELAVQDPDAQLAIRQIDSALDQIDSARAALGAVLGRFTSIVTSLQTGENLSASRNPIQDARFASETADLTRAQILQHAATAILAQANSEPNKVLTLLKG